MDNALLSYFIKEKLFLTSSLKCTHVILNYIYNLVAFSTTFKKFTCIIFNKHLFNTTSLSLFFFFNKKQVYG